MYMCNYNYSMFIFIYIYNYKIKNYYYSLFILISDSEKKVHVRYSFILATLHWVSATSSMGGCGCDALKLIPAQVALS